MLGRATRAGRPFASYSIVVVSPTGFVAPSGSPQRLAVKLATLPSGSTVFAWIVSALGGVAAVPLVAVSGTPPARQLVILLNGESAAPPLISTSTNMAPQQRHSVANTRPLEFVGHVVHPP